MPCGTLRGALLLAALVVCLSTLRAAHVDAAPAGQSDPDIVVQVLSPLPGERLQGSVQIVGYAADRRSNNASGINVDDIQLYLDSFADERNLIGFAGGGRPSPEAVALLGPQYNLAGFQRVWDTCSVSPGPHELIVWVSSLAAPGARGALRMDVDVAPCPTATSAPSSQPTAPPASPSGSRSPGVVLLADTFDDPATGVFPPTSSAPGRSEAYDAGEYVVRRLGSEATGLVTVLLPGTYDNTSLAVDVRIMGETRQRVAALECRRAGSADERQYRLEVSPERGAFRLFRLADRQRTELAGWTPSTAIRPGNQVNRLEFHCEGSRLSATINGTDVITVQDATLQAGRLAISVGVLESALQTEGRFDNLVVTQR